MSEPAEGRYARHGLLPGWRQKALGEATVIVIGVGALGNVIAESLALAGVGHLILCDPDVIEASNLSRAPLFGPGDVGRRKAVAAADALRRRVPGLVVDTRVAPLVSGVGLAELRDVDLVVAGLDCRRARVQLAGRCALVGARWIDGGTTAWGGEVRPFLRPDDPDAACFACPLTPGERGESDAPWSCAEVQPEAVGASHPVAAVIGGWVSLYAVRALMGLHVPSRWLRVDGMHGMLTPVEVGRDPECPLHRRLPPAERVSVGAGSTVGELRALLPDGAVPLTWSPVMTRVECRAGHFAESRVGVPKGGQCPECGEPLRVWTTTSLAEVGDSHRLCDLGVASREVLAVHTTTVMSFAELTEESP